jgi:hypothetical protein
MPGDLSWPGGVLTRLLTQENATLNEFYLAITTPLRWRASLGADEFYRESGYEPLNYDIRAFPPPLFNLGGKLVLKRMAGEFSMQDYITRVHDLDGRILAVLLQAEIEQSPQLLRFLVLR